MYVIQANVEQFCVQSGTFFLFIKSVMVQVMLEAHC